MHLAYALNASEIVARKEIDFDLVAKKFGYSTTGMRALFDNIEETTGNPVFGLLPITEAPLVNAYDLVDETLHWNPVGAVNFARILEELFVRKFIDP